MGEATAVFGRITTFGEEENKHNLKVVSKLPSQTNGYSKFTKEMFNQNMLHGKMDYTIGFARSYKGVENHWEEWIDNFEEILREMKFDNAKVIVETEMYGSHQYFWKSKTSKSIDSKLLVDPYNLIEKGNWYYGEGHRNFWGMLSNLGWQNGFEELRTLKTLAQLLDKSISTEVIATLDGENLNQLILKANKDGIKSVISNLIKLYLNAAEQEVEGYTKSHFDIKKVLSESSKINVNKIDLITSETDVKWILRFVDELLEQKKGSL